MMKYSNETMSNERQAPLRNPFWHLINSRKRMRCTNTMLENEKNDKKKFKLPLVQTIVDETNGGNVLNHGNEIDSITFFQDDLTAIITMTGDNICNNNDDDNNNESNNTNSHSSIPSIIYIPNKSQSAQSVISTMNQICQLPSLKEYPMMNERRTRGFTEDSCNYFSLINDDGGGEDKESICQDESLNNKGFLTSPFLMTTITGNKEEENIDDFHLLSPSLGMSDDWSVDSNIVFDSKSFLGAHLFDAHLFDD